MTSQLLIVGTLGFLFRALREQRLANNNTYSALSHYVHEKGGRNPLERSLACMVPEARLELARCCQRWILSPLRLPIPPLGHVMRELVYHSFLPISPKMELRAFR